GFAWPAGYPAAGGLLPHHFTLAYSGSPETIADGGVISVALSFGSPRLGVTQRPALWSPDFPPTLFTSPAVTRPPRPEWILPAGPWLLNPLVESHVGERVRAAVLLSLDVLELDLRESALEVHDLANQRLQLRALDPVVALDLLDHELGVQVDLEAIRLP